MSDVININKNKPEPTTNIYAEEVVRSLNENITEIEGIFTIYTVKSGDVYHISNFNADQARDLFRQVYGIDL